MNEFQTKKAQLSQGRIIKTPPCPIKQGQVLAKIDKFAFTANNITYAVLGDRLQYWDFFAPHGEHPEQWGIIPVWGFADIIESRCPEMPVGERLFGYFPPATSLCMTPSKVSPHAFLEASPQRSHLPNGYKHYRRVNAEPNYNKTNDDEHMLLYILHLTSFCLYDMLSSNAWFNAEQIVIISASSKTSTGLAYGLSGDSKSPSLVGLTSKRNTTLVESLDVYDQVCDYDNIDQLNPNLATTVIDMSANTHVLGALQAHFGQQLRHCCNVGLTHWEASKPTQESNPNLPQPDGQPFFAPTYIQQRLQDWGAATFEQRSMHYIQNSIKQSRRWLAIRHLNGLTDLAMQYNDIANGLVPADQGLVVVMP